MPLLLPQPQSMTAVATTGRNARTASPSHWHIKTPGDFDGGFSFSRGVASVAACGHGPKEQRFDPTKQENSRARCYFVCMSKVSIEADGIDAFVVYNGVRIAKRGQPNTPEAGTWVSLEPGFRVFHKGYPAKLVIERNGKIIKNIW